MAKLLKAVHHHLATRFDLAEVRLCSLTPVSPNQARAAPRAVSQRFRSQEMTHQGLFSRLHDSF
jgi:hypothetical protein